MAPAETGADGRQDASAGLAIEVVHSPVAGCVERVSLVLEVGSTVGQAVARSGFLTRHAVLQSAQGLRCGVWGVHCDDSQVLQDGDRVELYRPLAADPKEARRRRQVQQGGGRRGR